MEGLAKAARSRFESLAKASRSMLEGRTRPVRSRLDDLPGLSGRSRLEGL